jgi:hypothetical protein
VKDTLDSEGFDAEPLLRMSLYSFRERPGPAGKETGKAD